MIVAESSFSSAQISATAHGMVDERLAALAHLAGVVVAGVVERGADLLRVEIRVVRRDPAEQLGQQVVVPFGLGAAGHRCHTRMVVEGAGAALTPPGTAGTAASPRPARRPRGRWERRSGRCARRRRCSAGSSPTSASTVRQRATVSGASGMRFSPARSACQTTTSAGRSGSRASSTWRANSISASPHTRCTGMRDPSSASSSPPARSAGGSSATTAPKRRSGSAICGRLGVLGERDGAGAEPGRLERAAEHAAAAARCRRRAPSPARRRRRGGRWWRPGRRGRACPRRVRGAGVRSGATAAASRAVARQAIGHRADGPHEHLHRRGAVPLVARQPVGDVVAAAGPQVVGRAAVAEPHGAAAEPAQLDGHAQVAAVAHPLDAVHRRGRGEQRRRRGCRARTARAAPARRPARATPRPGPAPRRCAAAAAGRRSASAASACAASASAKASMSPVASVSPAATRWPP